MIPEIAQRLLDNYNNYASENPLELKLFLDEYSISLSFNDISDRNFCSYIQMKSFINVQKFSVFELWSPYDAQLDSFGVTLYCEIMGCRWIYDKRYDCFCECNSYPFTRNYRFEELRKILKITEPENKRFRILKN